MFQAFLYILWVTFKHGNAAYKAKTEFLQF